MKTAPILVLYDGECPFCAAQVRWLGRLDWFHRLEPVPLSDSRAREAAPQLSRDELMEAIHCVAPGGRVERGARALRFLGLRLPLLAPLAAALWIPGLIGLAEAAYRQVSRNRYLLSRFFGCRDSCPHSRDSQ